MPLENESVIEGTSIKKSQMLKMMEHSSAITGVPINKDPASSLSEDSINHKQIAQGITKALPNLVEDVKKIPVLKARQVKEGVQGTAPSPGQDNIAFVPPTTSNTSDPSKVGKTQPDAEVEPADKPANIAPQDPTESSVDRAIATMFEEYGKEEEEEESDPDEGEEEEGKDDEGEEGEDKDDKKDKKGKKDDDEGEEGEEEESEPEIVEGICPSCGFEESYDISPASIQEGQVPITPDGKLDTKCPMCSADMDFSLMGATPQGEIMDKNPRTDPRGNTQQSVPEHAIKFARVLMNQVVEKNAKVEDLVEVVVESDFLPRKKTA